MEKDYDLNRAQTKQKTANYKSSELGFQCMKAESQSQH